MKPRSSTLKALIATYAVLLTYLPVTAADLPPGPLPRTSVAAPVPYYNWTGFYVGVNGGGAWGSQDPWNIVTNRFDHFSTNKTATQIVGFLTTHGYERLGRASAPIIEILRDPGQFDCLGLTFARCYLNWRK